MANLVKFKRLSRNEFESTAKDDHTLYFVEVTSLIAGEQEGRVTGFNLYLGGVPVIPTT